MVDNCLTSLTIIEKQSTVLFKALLCTAGPVGTVGGIEGNVYGFNPTTGIMGPICGDYWTYKNVPIFTHTSISNI